MPLLYPEMQDFVGDSARRASCRTGAREGHRRLRLGHTPPGVAAAGVAPAAGPWLPQGQTSTAAPRQARRFARAAERWLLFRAWSATGQGRRRSSVAARRPALHGGARASSLSFVYPHCAFGPGARVVLLYKCRERSTGETSQLSERESEGLGRRRLALEGALAGSPLGAHARAPTAHRRQYRKGCWHAAG